MTKLPDSKSAMWIEAWFDTQAELIAAIVAEDTQRYAAAREDAASLGLDTSDLDTLWERLRPPLRTMATYER